MCCDTMLRWGFTIVTALLQAVGQHWAGIGSVYRVWVYMHIVVRRAQPARCHARYRIDAGQRCRRWPCGDINTSMKHCPVLYGCWPAPATVNQHGTGVGLVPCWLVVDSDISHKLWWTLIRRQFTAGKHILKGPLGMRHFQCCQFWKFNLNKAI